MMIVMTVAMMSILTFYNLFSASWLFLSLYLIILHLLTTIPYPPHIRRIDIKVWPVAEYWFAILHFTGSGHFNRSMRFMAHFLQWKDPRTGVCTLSLSIYLSLSLSFFFFFFFFSLLYSLIVVTMMSILTQPFLFCFFLLHMLYILITNQYT